VPPGGCTRTGDPQRICLVIHHTGEGKAGVAKAIGYDRGAFGRNSKTLKTWARAQFNVAPATPDDNSQIILASGKCNNFEEFSPVCARLNAETSILRAAGGGLEKNEALARLQSAGIGTNTGRALISSAVAAGEIEATPHQREGKRSGIFLTLA
jgi:hypothetical protein